MSWPYIRRGNRCSYDIAAYLATKGHEVDYITSKPGRMSRRKSVDNLSLVYHRFVNHPVLSRFKLDMTGSVIPSFLSSLLKEDYDIVQATFPTDGFVASLHKSMRGTPFVYLVIGCEPCHYPYVLFGKHMFDRVAKLASEMITVSEYVDKELKRECGRSGVMIPPAVDVDHFSPAERKDPDHPVILCTASVSDPRKRVSLLVQSFVKLLAVMPHAVLQLAGDVTPTVLRDIMMSVKSSARRAIEFLCVTSDETLASLYRNATVTVLPSLRERFGLVITESLASGTPVVGTRSGAIPEILDDPAIGVLFDASDGPDELCKALIRGIELARDPMTSLRCRNHVERRYTWQSIGPQYESLYERVLEGQKRKGYLFGRGRGGT